MKKQNLKAKWHNWNDPIAHRAGRKARELSDIRRINKIVALAEGDTLEIGCGDGTILYDVADKFPGNQHLGVDCCQALIERCSTERDKRNLKNLSFYCCMAEECSDVFSMDFQTVILAEILEHVLFPYFALVEAHNALRDGGKLIVTVPSKEMPSKLHLRHYYESGLRHQLEVFFRTVEITDDGVFCLAVCTDKI